MLLSLYSILSGKPDKQQHTTGNPIRLNALFRSISIILFFISNYISYTRVGFVMLFVALPTHLLSLQLCLIYTKTNRKIFE